MERGSGLGITWSRQSALLRALAWVALLSTALGGCIPAARVYKPVNPAKTAAPDPELQPRYLARDTTHTGVVIEAHSPILDVSFGRPMLSSPDKSPCTGGTPAVTWGSSASSENDKPTVYDPTPLGNVSARFENAATDRERLLLDRPTVLDVPMFTGSAPTAQRTCVRLPVLQADGTVEWKQRPSWWFRDSIFVEVPVHELSNVAANLLLTGQFGLFLGPLRAGIGAGFGGGFSGRDPRTGESGTNVLLVEALVGSPTLAFGRFGMSMDVGYVFEWWSKGTDVVTGESVDVGVSGPQATLLFRFLQAPAPRSPAYDARVDTWSWGFALHGSLLHTSDGEGPTPTIGGSTFIDIGL